jgi:hypothetical protein
MNSVSVQTEANVALFLNRGFDMFLFDVFVEFGINNTM